MTADVAPQDLAELYRDLHAHPELSFQERRTARLVAQRLRTLGYQVSTGVGGTGVVGVLGHGRGPTALLRADMDALPVREQTGLPYASTLRGVDGDGHDVPVMHACGHDMHVACLLGACQVLAEHRASWSGRLLAVFQPAEEIGRGAQAMIDDGLFERFGHPAVVLGQHVTALPAGVLALHPGPTSAASDSLRITLVGQGGHGSRPESSVDPVVMAAATILRLQTVVSREVAGTDTAVVTVGAVRAGTKENIIPDQAELLVSIRTFDGRVRRRVLAAVERIVRAEAAASGAPRDPELTCLYSLPAVINDAAAATRTRAAFQALLGEDKVLDTGPITASEDVGLLACAAGAPCCYWRLGGADPAAFTGAPSTAEVVARAQSLPANHSPRYAPVIAPTLGTGIAALVTAAQTWLPPSG